MLLIGLFLAVCLGAAIGVRFRVYVLVYVLLLAIAAVSALIVARGLAAEPTFLASLGELIGAMVALQIGYLLGTFARAHMRETSVAHAAHEAGRLRSLTAGFSEFHPD